MHKIFEIKNFHKIILITSLLSILIALYIEFFLGFNPCKLCIYQRVPYLVAILISFLGIVYSKNLIWLYLLLINFFISFLLSGYHFGIEQEIFKEFSPAKATIQPQAFVMTEKINRPKGFVHTSFGPVFYHQEMDQSKMDQETHQPVVFLHDFGTSSNATMEISNYCQGTNQKLFVDLPGHGETGVTYLEDYLPNSIAKMLADGLKQLNLGEIHLLAILWSPNYLLTKIASEEIGPFWLTSSRFLISSFILSIILILSQLMIF